MLSVVETVEPNVESPHTVKLRPYLACDFSLQAVTIEPGMAATTSGQTNEWCKLLILMSRHAGRTG